MKIVVIGSTGTIGKAVTQLLRTKKHEGLVRVAALELAGERTGPIVSV